VDGRNIKIIVHPQKKLCITDVTCVAPPHDRMRGMRDKFGKMRGDKKFGIEKEDAPDFMEEKFDQLEEELNPRLDDKDGKKQDVLKKLKNLKESKLRGKRF